MTRVATFAVRLRVAIEDDGLLHWLLLVVGQLVGKPATVHVGLPGKQVDVVMLTDALRLDPKYHRRDQNAAHDRIRG